MSRDEFYGKAILLVAVQGVAYAKTLFELSEEYGIPKEVVMDRIESNLAEALKSLREAGWIDD